MIKVRLKLRALKDIGKTGWKAGDVTELVNSIFDKNTGLAYFSIDQDWEIIKMELLEYKEIHV